LRLDAEAAGALPGGRHPLVGDDALTSASVQNCVTLVAQFCTRARSPATKVRGANNFSGLRSQRSPDVTV
jgi:hypothetical protein